MARICRDIDCIVEVFGCCRGEYCRQERRGLVERARQEARDLGHTMSPFEKARNHPVWQAKCEHCGLQVSITVSADPGEPDIYGDALLDACSSVQDPPA
jgi:hypothetical protein